MRVVVDASLIIWLLGELFNFYFTELVPPDHFIDVNFYTDSRDRVLCVSVFIFPVI